MASVELKAVSKSFRPERDKEIHAVRHLDLNVADGELLVLVGPSGSGKTTVLRLIAGLEEPSSGEILINGLPTAGSPPQDRDIAMVFQRDALYPHMTVFENMAFGLRLRKVRKAEIATRVEATAGMLGIVPLLQRHPRQLSGGERQRAALGRALVRQPKVLLLDEPLSHLDAPLRTQLRAEIATLHQQLRLTTLYVTHDQAEAFAFGQRIAVMNHGKIEQVGDVSALRTRPANPFVADFLKPIAY
jgi:multiple sugar transport system ATP-binding protein